MLHASNIRVRFAGVTAVDDVSMALDAGEIVGLIGPNGAGKTTIVNVLSGFQRPQSGGVEVDGVPARGRSPAWFARNGVVRTFQAVRLFRELTVGENVEAALCALGVGRGAARARAAELLDFVGIGALANRRAAALSYGDERRAGLARALAAGPRYLLLDEPAAGLNLGEAERLDGLIRLTAKTFGCAILLIEHNMRLVMDVCQRVCVVAGGRTIAQGPPAAVMADPAFRAAYLGTQGAA